MLGLADLDAGIGSECIEQLHSKLKTEFWDKNSVQALAQILVFGSSSDGEVDRVLALRDALKVRKLHFDKSYALPSLGVLTRLPVDINAIARD